MRPMSRTKKKTKIRYWVGTRTRTCTEAIQGLENVHNKEHKGTGRRSGQGQKTGREPDKDYEEERTNNRTQGREWEAG